MPDQSSAATEHALLQEITAPLQDLPEDPQAVVSADFPTTLRGYDRLAVDEYVRRTSHLVAELQATRSPEAAVRRALERVGDQISGVLQRAHETAEQITAQSRSEAEDRMEAARREAAQIMEAAEQRVRELDADTDRIWSERQRIVGDADDLSAQLKALAEEAARRFEPDIGHADESEDEAGDEAPVAAFEAVQWEEEPGIGEEEPAVEEEDEEEVALLDEVAAPEADEAAAEEEATAEHPATESPDASEIEDTQVLPPQPPPSPRKPSSIIPPASQAANRRRRG